MKDSCQTRMLLVFLVFLMSSSHLANARPPRNETEQRMQDQDKFKGEDSLHKEVDRQKRHISDIATWPNGEVVYKIGNIAPSLIGPVKEAIKQWEATTCLKFIEWDGIDNDQPRVEFVNTKYGCLSASGYTGGRQSILLSYTCSYIGVLLHEIGHTIGMAHEHTRGDRDDYITVIEENIENGYSGDFDINYQHVTDKSIPYDLGSIMQYDPKTFSIGDTNTFESHDPDKQSAMGRQERLSHIDGMFVNDIYSCNEHCDYPRLECKNGGYIGKDCICVCPEGLVGDLCEDLAASKTSSECGGHFTNDNGEISSPDYPLVYPMNTQCYYLIEAPEGYHIELSFDVFQIEPYECWYDNLLIRYDALYFDTSAARYCGETLKGRTITSYGNTMMLDFTCDDYNGVPVTGFHANYVFVDQRITSENYPNPYSEDSVKTWDIVVPVVGFSYLVFETMAVEAEYDKGCYDSVKVTVNGIETEYCGQLLPDAIYLPNDATVEFQSDRMCELEGFVLQKVVLPYKVDDWDGWSEWGQCSANCGTGFKSRTRTCPHLNNCGLGSDTQTMSCYLDSCKDACQPEMIHTKTSTGGIIQSPGYPFQYPQEYFEDKETPCSITIDVPVGQNVTFSFKDIDVSLCSDRKNCKKDSLTFVVQDDKSSPYVFCGTDEPNDIEFDRSVDVVFKTAKRYPKEDPFNRGFDMTYTFSDY